MSSSLARAAEPCPDGWLSLSPAGSNGKRLKRTPPRVEDAGTPLGDEILLRVFAGYSLGTADLVRCAATCRRWRRLVSGDAEFICRLMRPSYFRHLAVGFFHRSHDAEPGAPPRFLPFDSCSSRRARIRANAAAAALGGDVFKSFRLVASRNGRLVLELRRASRGAALRLAVLNPVTGDVEILPALSGKDTPGSYACALLAASDDVTVADPPRRAPAAAFRLLIVYRRRHFTACRSYSSGGAKAWGPEGRPSGAARIGGARLGEMDAGVAARGAVFWLHGDTVLSLRADTLEAVVESFPIRKRRARELCRCLGGAAGQNRRLAVSPDGGLIAMQVGSGSLNSFVINVFRRDDGERVGKRRWTKALDIDLNPFLPRWFVERVCIRAVCEKSGLVFFATRGDVYEQQGARRQDLALYVLDLETKEVREVPAPEGRCSVRKSSWSFHGYEMDMVSYLSSLAGRDSLI